MCRCRPVSPGASASKQEVARLLRRGSPVASPDTRSSFFRRDGHLFARLSRFASSLRRALLRSLPFFLTVTSARSPIDRATFPQPAPNFVLQATPSLRRPLSLETPNSPVTPSPRSFKPYTPSDQPSRCSASFASRCSRRGSPQPSLNQSPTQVPPGHPRRWNVAPSLLFSRLSTPHRLRRLPPSSTRPSLLSFQSNKSLRCLP